MVLGPVEIVTIGFREGRFDGSIIPELEKLVNSGVISIIDGIFVRKDGEGDVTLIEFDEPDASEDVAALSRLLDHADGLVSDEDIDELTEDLPMGAAAAVLVFEHTWVVPLRDAVVAAGGELLDTVRIPGPVAQEVLDAVTALENN